jgi:hypothetical protein
MIRQLTTLILSGLLGSIVLVGNAEACHQKRCGCAPAVACAAPQPAPCVQVVKPCKPAPCAWPVATQCCAPKVKTCHFRLPKFHHKSCASPVALACVTPVYYGAPAPAGYPVASPQGSAQH